MNGQFRFQLPDPPPSRICMDLAEWTGNGTGVFGWSGKASRSSRVEWGGFTFWPSPQSDRTELEQLGAPWGLSFCIDGDPVPFSGRRRIWMPLSSCCRMGPTGRPDWSRSPAFRSTPPGRRPPGSGSSCGGKHRRNNCMLTAETGRPTRGDPFLLWPSVF